MDAVVSGEVMDAVDVDWKIGSRVLRARDKVFEQGRAGFRTVRDPGLDAVEVVAGDEE